MAQCRSTSPWEIGQGRKHNAFRDLFDHVFAVHFRGLVVPLARASCPVNSSPCVSVICLCCFLPRHRRIPARPLVKTAPCFLMVSFVNGCPVLPDGFIEWVVLREARSQRFPWALTDSHLSLLDNFGLRARTFLRLWSLQVFVLRQRVFGLQGHSVNELHVGADPEIQRCTAPVRPRPVGWAAPFRAVLPSGHFAGSWMGAWTSLAPLLCSSCLYMSARPSLAVPASWRRNRDLCVSLWFLVCRVHVFFISVRPVVLPGVFVSCSRSPLSCHCSICACAPVRTVPYFLMGSLFGCRSRAS